MKPAILILTAHYLPGYKGGGPIQSCRNMVDKLSQDFDFMIVTSDRDLKETKPYDTVKVGEWNDIGYAKVYYLSPGQLTFGGIRRIIKQTRHDLLYINGYFNPIFSIRPIILRKLGLIPRTRCIIAPRGAFTGGCENKRMKKMSFIRSTRLLGMYNGLLWHATSELERADILHHYPKAEVSIVSNLAAQYHEKQLEIRKEAGKLRLLFVSRIFPKKNIQFALEALSMVKQGEITYDIYGPMEDKAYWAACEAVIQGMPNNIHVRYCGSVPHHEIAGIYRKYHGFLFPTLGENYGHVIVEAMMNNCIAILSKGTTPWDAYGRELGVVAPLTDKQAFVDILERMTAMNDEEMQRMVGVNSKLMREYFDESALVEMYRSLLGGKQA